MSSPTTSLSWFLISSNSPLVLVAQSSQRNYLMDGSVQVWTIVVLIASVHSVPINGIQNLVLRVIPSIIILNITTL